MMKKLTLIIIFALFLVSFVNADSYCSEGRVAEGYPVGGPLEGEGLLVSIRNLDYGNVLDIGEIFNAEVIVENELDNDVDVVV